MADISTVVTSIHPSSGATGTLVGDTVTVLFSTELDENSIKNGNLFITGPSDEIVTGPDQSLIQAGPTLGNSLTPPPITGVITGNLTFQRIDLADLNLSSTTDPAGTGNLYRTKAIFTSDKQFLSNTKFTVYLTGNQDSNATPAGIRARSVFDPTHVGTGPASSVQFTGSWLRAGNDVINIEIVMGGAVHTATFNWWLSSAPGVIYGPITTTPTVFLTDNLSVTFTDTNGPFIANDEYTAPLKNQVPYTGAYIWVFTTGSGAIETVPTTTSTSVIGDLVPVTSAISSFDVSRITPLDRATNLPVTTKQMVIEFTANIDPATVTADRIQVVAGPTNGDPTILTDRILYTDINVSGNKITINF